ncbi:MAG: hypothetical protein GKR95_25470 [Gammaproteobacteria bacterium]|nr:hypothetical protein [Gammaproteobacteria bacterium]NKB63632.1 hypothetical protein [Gammaproteobacteria bacterium]NKB65306.1 hypothetical protein [Gammaproteobacteria bacterium]
MTIHQYLDRYISSDSVTLVGPLYQPRGDLNHFEEPVLFVDGGTRFRRLNEGYALGDGDSYHGVLDTVLEREKDFSDLAFALGNLGPNFTSISLLGFLGGRRDHEFFNFGEVHQFVRRRSPGTKVLFDEDAAIFSAGRWQFELHGLFSLGTLETTSFTMTGECQYQVPELTELAPLSSLGLSNFGHGVVTILCDDPMLLFMNVRE